MESNGDMDKDKKNLNGEGIMYGWKRAGADILWA